MSFVEDMDEVASDLEFENECNSSDDGIDKDNSSDENVEL